MLKPEKIELGALALCVDSSTPSSVRSDFVNLKPHSTSASEGRIPAMSSI